jgi:serine/threonine-protein kinase
MATQSLEVGYVLADRYAIQEIIGRGGMGTVYRALDRRLDTVVAVKEMIDRHTGDEEREIAVRQFEREAKLLAQLSHPNLPRVTDYFVQDDRWYLIMEYVVGRTLEKVLTDANGKPLPVKEVLTWGIQLADVLSFLHGQTPPIVFRDLKPANIMLQDDGVIRLIDFGIARRFQDGATKDTLLYGSPGYSPPEQYGRSQTDARSDLYALGATLHHLATGRDPSPTPFKFPSATSLNPDISAALDTAIMRCVEMEITKRMETASELRDLLLRLRQAEAASEMLGANRPVSGPAGRAPSGPHAVVSAPIRRSSPAVREPALPIRIVAIVALLVVVVLGAVFVVNSRKGAGKSTTKPPVNSGASNVVGSGTPPVGVQQPTGTNGDNPVTSGSGGTTNPPTSGSDSSGPAVAHLSIEPAQSGFLPGSKPGTPVVRGIRVHGSIRLESTGPRNAVVRAFFYNRDGSIAQTPSSELRSADGQLVPSASLTLSPNTANPFSIDIPNEALSASYDQLGYRITVFVDEHDIGHSEILPVTQ